MTAWEVSSLPLCTAYLERWMRGTPADVNPNMPRDQFRWVGGSLLYAECDLDGFVAGVRARCPEMAAAERALQVAARIDSASVGDAPVAVAKHRRRVGV